MTVVFTDRKLLCVGNASHVVQKYLSGHLTIGPVLVRTVVCEYRTSSDINGIYRIVIDGHHLHGLSHTK